MTPDQIEEAAAALLDAERTLSKAHQELYSGRGKAFQGQQAQLTAKDRYLANLFLPLPEPDLRSVIVWQTT